MKITLDDGTTFDVSGAAATGRLTNEERTTIRNALHDAAQLLDQDQHIIASISADIQSAIGRIETELGGHPAFTWAQTTLSGAIRHLENYVRGIWQEPIAAAPALAAAPVDDASNVAGHGFGSLEDGSHTAG